MSLKPRSLGPSVFISLIRFGGYWVKVAKIWLRGAIYFAASWFFLWLPLTALPPSSTEKLAWPDSAQWSTFLLLLLFATVLFFIMGFLHGAVIEVDVNSDDKVKAGNREQNAFGVLEWTWGFLVLAEIGWVLFSASKDGLISTSGAVIVALTVVSWGLLKAYRQVFPDDPGKGAALSWYTDERRSWHVAVEVHRIQFAIKGFAISDIPDPEWTRSMELLAKAASLGSDDAGAVIRDEYQRWRQQPDHGFNPDFNRWWHLVADGHRVFGLGGRYLVFAITQLGIDLEKREYLLSRSLGTPASLLLLPEFLHSIDAGDSDIVPAFARALAALAAERKDPQFILQFLALSANEEVTQVLQRLATTHPARSVQDSAAAVLRSIDSARTRLLWKNVLFSEYWLA